MRPAGPPERTGPRTNPVTAWSAGPPPRPRAKAKSGRLKRLAHRLLCGLALLPLCLAPLASAQVILTEFMASNTRTLADDFGSYA